MSCVVYNQMMSCVVYNQVMSSVVYNQIMSSLLTNISSDHGYVFISDLYTQFHGHVLIMIMVKYLYLS